jgi:hypothetical protein
MDKIEFENGSEIKIIDVNVANTRSKRGQEQLQKIKEYYKYNPDKYIEEMLGVRLYPYQKAMLKLMSTKERLLDKFRFRRR